MQAIVEAMFKLNAHASGVDDAVSSCFIRADTNEANNGGAMLEVDNGAEQLSLADPNAEQSASAKQAAEAFLLWEVNEPFSAHAQG